MCNITYVARFVITRKSVLSNATKSESSHFNIILVISQRPVHLSMFSWSSSPPVLPHICLSYWFLSRKTIIEEGFRRILQQMVKTGFETDF